MSFAKAEQLLELAGMIAARRAGATLDDVADRFGCSRRTAQRMMGAVENRFPDIVAAMSDDGRKRWRMDGHHYRELMTLAPDELAALDFAMADLARAGHFVEERNLRRLKDKVLALVPRKNLARIETDHEALLEAQGFVARPGPRPKVDEACVAAVLEAIKSCHVLNLVYRSHKDSAPRKRRVAPYGILSGMRQYLVGASHDEQRRPIRTYRLDAVVSVSVSEESFKRPEQFDLQAFANRAFGVFQSDEEFGEVIWRFRPEVAEEALGYQFHPSQVVTKEPDGSIVVQFYASGHLEMCWHLYSWGNKVEVLKPGKLRDMINDYQRADFPAAP